MALNRRAEEQSRPPQRRRTEHPPLPLVSKSRFAPRENASSEGGLCLPELIAGGSEPPRVPRWKSSRSGAEVQLKARRRAGEQLGRRRARDRRRFGPRLQR